MKSKKELQDIAQEAFELLRTKELPAWQCREVLLFVKDLIDNVMVN